MLRMDDCRLMLDQSIDQIPNAPRQSVVYLYPDDIADYHATVKANGLSIPELDVTFYGMTEFRIEVAKNYVTHSDLRKFEDTLVRIEAKLDAKADK